MFDIFGSNEENDTDNDDNRLHITADILHDKDNDQFILGYSPFDDDIRILGVGDTLSDAFRKTADHIDNTSYHITTTEINNTIRRGSPTSFDVTMYINRKENEYHIEIVDSKSNKFEATGHNAPETFRNLADEIPGTTDPKN